MTKTQNQLNQDYIMGTLEQVKTARQVMASASMLSILDKHSARSTILDHTARSVIKNDDVRKKIPGILALFFELSSILPDCNIELHKGTEQLGNAITIDFL